MVFFANTNDTLQPGINKNTKIINRYEVTNIFKNGSVYTCREVAEKLRLSESTVRDMVFGDRIPSFKCGNGKRAARRFEGAELNEWLSSSDDSRPVEQPAVHYIKRTGKGRGLKEFEAFVASMDNRGE